MFTAINNNNEKLLAFQDDKAHLYKLAKAKKLYCPHCKKHVFFRGGPKRIYHFYHERHVECSFVEEPETQEHLGGKLAIYDWLKEKYPQAYVALEERIAKTNQIADVYVAFENGNKVAFEIQCAEQSAEKWLERRKLYAVAGVKDIWLFGANFYKEVPVDDVAEDEVVLRLKYPQQLVNEKDRSVYFIDVKHKSIKHVGQFFGMRYRTETRVVAKLQEMSISEMVLAKIQAPCKYVLCDALSYEQLQHYFTALNIRYDLKDSWQVATLIHSYLVLLEKCGFLAKKKVYRKYKQPCAKQSIHFTRCV